MTRLKILGGPGCGKTTYLKQCYIAFIDAGYKPDDITLITFRKTAALDLIAAVSTICNVKDDVKEHVGTIHSVCHRLTGYRELVDKRDLATFKRITGYNIAGSGNDVPDADVYTRGPIDAFYYMRNTGVSNLYGYPGYNALGDIDIMDFCERWTTYKKEIGKIDYSDMIQTVIDDDIPLDTPILMVDEFQDLTAQMNNVVNSWAPSCEHVVIAGDPFQAIYGFFGGSPNYFNSFNANLHILEQTHRLPVDVLNFAQSLLRHSDQYPPALQPVNATPGGVSYLGGYDEYPVHRTELHLVRCNWQIPGIAKDLAIRGKPFISSNPRVTWTEDEFVLANAIITYRNGGFLTPKAMQAIINAYPDTIFGGRLRKSALLDLASESKPQSVGYLGIRMFQDDLNSILRKEDPITPMDVTELTKLKLGGIYNRTAPIKRPEMDGRKILTIHGSKGLEADAVYLHSAVTREIERSMITLPGIQAEARVWYVGATRARKHLYIIRDAGTQHYANLWS